MDVPGAEAHNSRTWVPDVEDRILALEEKLAYMTVDQNEINGLPVT